MKKHWLYSLLALLFCLTFCQQTAAQRGHIYSTTNGLSSSLINSLYQDSRGFVWCTTEYGLNRFDGFRFSTYLHLPDDTTSIKNNYVHTIFEDSSRDLLVGCIDGVMKYSRETDAFCEIPMLRAGKQVTPHITQMSKLSNGEIWISTTGQGMFRLDERQLKAFSLDDMLASANYNYQSCFYEDSQGDIWIGTYGSGVIHYKLKEHTATVFCHPVINDNNVYAISEDKRGTLFIGTQKQGLSRFDRTENVFIPVSCVNGESVSVYCLQEVDGRMLVGTDGQGLKWYNPETDKMEAYNLLSVPLDISTGKIHTIIVDRDDNLWLGLFQKGIILLPKSENQFEYFGVKSAAYNPIGSGCVMSVFQSSDRHLWVGTDNEGLFELDTDGHRLRHFLPNGSPQSVANTVMCMFEDSEKNFWIGSYTRGVGLMDRHTGICKYDFPIDNEKVLSITEDKFKNLYISTLGSGFYRYNLLTKKIEHIESSKDESGDLHRDELPNDWLNYIFCDSDGLVWIAHYKGISCYNPHTRSFLDFKHTNTLIAGCIGYVLIESADGKIWAGTSEGLYCFDKKTDEIQRFTVNEGLPNNVICGICEDRQLNIWLSTYMGISRYDTREKHFVNYYASDGLQGNEFSHGAFCKAESGKMYFGGTNGVTGFLPQNISNVPKMPGVWIIGFYLSENPVCKNSLSGGKPIIDCAVQDAKNFQLSCQDNTFSIILSTMQYGNSEQISYQYKIDELNKRWQSTELGINRVTYNNLPPGKYTFSVRAVNRGIMSSVRKITIQIVPPWYQTRGAYCAYVLLIGLMAWGIANVFFTRIKHRREIMKREHAEQLNEAKLQFFINISHEIRTPMTLIINPLEKLLSAEKDGELHKTYQMIYRNAQRILRLINQLMDIRKLDKGQMLLKCQETDMVGFIKDVMQPFECLAREKKISFIFKHECPQLKTWIDLNNFDKVLMNILSNAFKYTPDGGEIEISLAEGRDAEREDALKNYFDIVIADTGIGINANEIEHIFERFYQVESNVTQSNFGTGIGLHLSRSLVELHHGIIFAENREDRQGCRFIIRLPLGSAHLRADELGKETGDASFVHTVKPVVEIGETLGTEQGNNKIVKAKTRQRILIAEDEEEIRNYLKSELEDEYHVQTCNNGKEAYELTLKEMPDLVISDVMMPEMDGLEFCRKVKHNTEINHIPIVLLTAKSRIEDTLEGMETGVDAYIVKPFNTDLLKSTIANLLGNRRLLRNKFNGSQKQEDKMEKIVLKSNDEILMERIMKVVNDHLDDPDFNVEAFALEVGMSRVHLHRKLKELTNLSARDFIKNIRLQQAAALLMQEKKLTISEVAYAVGYTSLSHFSNSFKEKYGVAPKEYIALHSV